MTTMHQIYLVEESTNGDDFRQSSNVAFSTIIKKEDAVENLVGNTMWHSYKNVS
jgi:hypothetical protein